ncbi:MAG: hypothetical protein ACK2UW_24665 [Anaerolineales bacterium]|jgi:hypothetical protein
MQAASRNLPDRDRISVLAGTILMAFSFTPYVSLPAINLTLAISGVVLPIQLNFRTLVSVLVAAMTAAGADWLVHDHPAFRGHLTVQHWLLPALTAWVIGSVLFTVPFNPLWWAAFAVGGLTLMLVLIAEYIVVDPEDARYPLAAAGLGALAFGLFLALAITLDTANLRLFMRLPFISLAAGLVSLRVLNLRLAGRWAIWESLLIVLLASQFVAVFHYWNLPPASYGLVLLAPIYGTINFLAMTESSQTLRRAVMEPALVSMLMLAGAIWLAFI